jgi:hypothetical protein
MNEQAEVKFEFKELRVRHRSKPSEPWAQPGAVGVITRDPSTGSLRITPKWKNTPAQAFVSWNEGDYFTWEKLADLIEIVKPRVDNRDTI